MKWGSHLNPPSSSPICSAVPVVLIPPNRTNHIEVVPCVKQVHRPLLEVIPQLSVDIMRGVPLPQAKLLAVGVDRCLEEMGQAQHLNVSPPGAVSVHTCGGYITLNTVIASEMVAEKVLGIVYHVIKGSMTHSQMLVLRPCEDVRECPKQAGTISIHASHTAHVWTCEGDSPPPRSESRLCGVLEAKFLTCTLLPLYIYRVKS